MMRETYLNYHVTRCREQTVGQLWVILHGAIEYEQVHFQQRCNITDVREILLNSVELQRRMNHVA